MGARRSHTVEWQGEQRFRYPGIVTERRRRSWSKEMCQLWKSSRGIMMLSAKRYQL